MERLARDALVAASVGGVTDDRPALRRQMNALTAAIREQPEDVRRAILRLLDQRRPR